MERGGRKGERGAEKEGRKTTLLTCGGSAGGGRSPETVFCPHEPGSLAARGGRSGCKANFVNLAQHCGGLGTRLVPTKLFQQLTTTTTMCTAPHG